MLFLQSLYKNSIFIKYRDYTKRDYEWFINSFLFFLTISISKNIHSMYLEVKHLPIFYPIPTISWLIKFPVAPHLYLVLVFFLYLFIFLSAWKRNLGSFFGLFIFYYFVTGIEESYFIAPHFFRFFHAKISPLYIIFLILSFLILSIKRDKKPYYLPIVLTHFILSIHYLSPNIERFWNDGFPGWYSIESIALICMKYALVTDSSAALMLSQSNVGLAVILFGTFLFEMSFFLCLIWPILMPIYFIGFIGFHGIVNGVLQLNYLYFFICLLSCFCTGFFICQTKKLVDSIANAKKFFSSGSM